MKYNEFIEKFNQLFSFDGSEDDRYYAKEDHGTIKIFCRDYLSAKLFFRNKYWEFSALSTFDSEMLKLMAELAETDPKFRDDTINIIDLGDKRNNATYIGFTNSSMLVDEDYTTVVKYIAQADKYMQLHKDGEPVLIAVDKVEVVGDMGDD